MSAARLIPNAEPADTNIIRAVARVVEAQGGDMDDVRDLLDVWRRVDRRNGERADVIRREALELAARLAPQDDYRSLDEDTPEREP